MDDCFDFNSSLALGSDHVVHSWWICSYSTGDCDNYDPHQDNPGKESDQMTTNQRESLFGKFI